MDENEEIERRIELKKQLIKLTIEEIHTLRMQLKKKDIFDEVVQTFS